MSQDAFFLQVNYDMKVVHFYFHTVSLFPYSVMMSVQSLSLCYSEKIIYCLLGPCSGAEIQCKRGVG